MALFKILSRTFRRYTRFPGDGYHYTPPEQLTLASYVYPQHAAVDQHLLGNSNSGYALFLKSVGGYSHLAARVGIYEVIDPNPIVKTKWLHAVLKWDGMTMELWKDGEKVVGTRAPKITYSDHLLDRSMWLFERNEGGTSYQLGLNLFTLWDVALAEEDIVYLAEGGDPGVIREDRIWIGDFLDNPGTSQIFGDIIPYDFTSEGIIYRPESPFKQGFVPYEVPIIIVSSDSSESTSDSSLSTLSSSSSSESSLSTFSTDGPSDSSSISEPSSTSSEGLTESLSSSSGNKFTVVFDVPVDDLIWAIPNDVDEIQMTVWGAGGGGGAGQYVIDGSIILYSNGGGAGGAEYNTGTIEVTPSGVLFVTVGAGGIGGPTAIMPGINGGLSQVRTATNVLIKAEGGKGGGSNDTISLAIGGEGGTGSGGLPGEKGQNGESKSCTISSCEPRPQAKGGLAGDENENLVGNGGNGGVPTVRTISGVSDACEVIDVTPSNTSYDLDLKWNAGGVADRLTIWAGGDPCPSMSGNKLYDSGCQPGADITTFQVPAFTDKLKFIVDSDCASQSPAPSSWQIDLTVVGQGDDGGDGRIVFFYTRPESSSTATSTSESSPFDDSSDSSISSTKTSTSSAENP